MGDDERRHALLCQARGEAVLALAHMDELIDRLEEMGTYPDVVASVRRVRDGLLAAMVGLGAEGTAHEEGGR